MPGDEPLRLPLTRLRRLELQHILSGIDRDSPPHEEGAFQTVITGFTEWVSTAHPIVTLGWDWQMQARGNQPWLCRIGTPRSNLLLQSHGRKKIDWIEHERLLQCFVDSLGWETESLKHIAVLYRNVRAPHCQV